MRIYLVGSAIACFVAFLVCYAASIVTTMPYAPFRGVPMPSGFTAGNGFLLAAFAFAFGAIVIMGLVWTKDDNSRSGRRW